MFVSVKDAAKKGDSKELKGDLEKFINEALDQGLRFYLKVKKGSVYSLIKEFVGRPNIIKHSREVKKYPGIVLNNKSIYLPVRHDDVIAVEIDRELIFDVRKGILSEASFFSGAIRYTGDGSFERLFTLRRDYVPGARDFYEEGCFSDQSLEKINQGGVCKEEGREEISGSSRLATVIRDIGPLKPVVKYEVSLIGELFYRWSKTRSLDVYLSGPNPVINYSFSVLEDESILNDDSSIIIKPKKIDVEVDDIFVLKKDLHDLNVSRTRAQAPYKKVFDAIESVQKLDDVPGYEDCRKTALQWICDEVGVEQRDVESAIPLVDLATIAVMVWKDVPLKGKADKVNCKNLINRMNKDFESFFDDWTRLVILNFNTAKRSGRNRAPYLVRKTKEDYWKKTALKVLIHAWKKNVLGLSRNARVPSYTKWQEQVSGYLKMQPIPDYMIKSVIEVILSEQDKNIYF
ncbi:hypothetical protein [Alloalcanivorax gelatiniphagus]|jgi:hypothetical protein|uniref:Uncharacterized protein n=1 Tax=Alloalcanivorax gelatiniphagus TaxID=1194167 RepID=A0ABY2XME9_9GAMM|nr:hypothetical protein [Alloalcanivorax gelatiniphagus]TMW12570.1 hypothetical protein FGS76_10045 [Alloalcanivorax gelatiniphagus]